MSDDLTTRATGYPRLKPSRFPPPRLAALSREEVAPGIRRVIAFEAFLIGINLQNFLRSIRIALQRRQIFQEPRGSQQNPYAFTITRLLSNFRLEIARRSRSDRVLCGCFQYHIWMQRRDAQENARRPARRPPSLLPLVQSANTDAQ